MWSRAFLDRIWYRALRSPYRATQPAGSRAALFALYVRGHWLRMPPLLLARHLFIKALHLHEHKNESVTVPAQG
jgi:hypothetical protein